MGIQEEIMPRTRCAYCAKSWVYKDAPSCSKGINPPRVPPTPEPITGATRWRSPEYRALVEATRERAAAGEGCYFEREGTCNHPGEPFIEGRGPASFTMHHAVRVMDGGDLVPDASMVFPAHRSC